MIKKKQARQPNTIKLPDFSQSTLYQGGSFIETLFIYYK